MGTPKPPPPHVRAAFGARDAEPELIDAGPMWRCGDGAFKPASSPAEAAWVAKAMGELHVPGLRIGRPLRSTDGRWVVGGWAAYRFIEGHAEPRHDEVISVSLTLHEALKGQPRPRFIDARQDVFAVADRVSSGELDVPLKPDRGGDLFAELQAKSKPTKLTKQVVHGDLFGNVLFVGEADPGLIDFRPYWRPPEWAAAVVVVDALAWGGADDGIIGRWSHLAEWPQTMLQALLFRLAVHALHPRSTAESLKGLARVAEQVDQLL
ncbi:TIGR02569 family protein [Kibdelosporangium persicum]|nr:TIGR02569 family protein [Kibdelosporangium persicum]